MKHACHDFGRFVIAVVCVGSCAPRVPRTQAEDRAAIREQQGAFADRRAADKAPAPTKVIDFGGGGWKDGQVNEPCILVNPKDASRLVMFYSGMKLGGTEGAIGKAWATVADPFTWHEDAANPVLGPDPRFAFEESAIRLDCVLYQEASNEYWIYYTGTTEMARVDAIGLAICTAGDDGYSAVIPANIERYQGNPILSPGGQGRADETHVSQGAVIREKGGWYSLYSYRTSAQVLPGIRLATSTDGKQWSKTPGPDLLAAAPESRYIEWHQVYKIAGRFVLVYEGYNGGTRWGPDAATSESLIAGWKKTPAALVDQTAWPNYSDDSLFHVATPALYRFNDRWYLYFQAAHSGSYSVQHWALWGVGCDEAVRLLLKAS